MKISAAFGSGMGGLANTCGAVTGAYMVIGLRYGGNKLLKSRTYKKVREFSGMFKALHKHLDCRDLLGCDVGTKEGRKKAKEEKLYKTKCTRYVEDAVNILEEVMGEK